MTPAISVAGLTRRYRGQLALDQVTFDLEPGSITGLLGRNGAGKTTLLRIVAGHEFASAGTVTVLGASPVENETVLRQMVFVREDHAEHPGPCYQLTDRYVVVISPWLILAINFLIEVVLVAGWPGRQGQAAYSGPAAIYVVLIIIGALAIARQLPFALALGVSRRSFYAGTALLSGALAAVYGLGLTVLQLIERGTGGWGLNLHFFRVPYLLAGPWYLSWLTSFAGLALMLAWGMWFGIVYRRWNLAGLLSFIAAQALALLLVLLTIGGAHDWHSVAHFFTTLTIEGLTGLLAALTVALLAGGYATVRRVTV